eukprot:4564579-Pleurochrysis_carterae.AAC.1
MCFLARGARSVEFRGQPSLQTSMTPQAKDSAAVFLRSSTATTRFGLRLAKTGERLQPNRSLLALQTLASLRLPFIQAGLSLAFAGEPRTRPRPRTWLFDLLEDQSTSF